MSATNLGEWHNNKCFHIILNSLVNNLVINALNVND